MRTEHELPSDDDSAEHVRLIAQAQPRLAAFILALVGRPTEVDDILQETNVVLWRRRKTFMPGTNFHAWAFKIARLQVLAQQSRKTHLRFDADLLKEIGELAEAESEHYERRAFALRACLEKLPAKQRDLITRRYQPGAAVNHLADELGKSAKAVSESLRRIREALRRCIEKTLSAEGNA